MEAANAQRATRIGCINYDDVFTPQMPRCRGCHALNSIDENQIVCSPSHLFKCLKPALFLMASGGQLHWLQINVRVFLEVR